MKKNLLLLISWLFSIGLWALNNVPYIDAEGTTKYVDDVTEITPQAELYTITDGWYIVRGENVITNTLVCEGAVNLILADNAKLTVLGDYTDAGIRVSAECTSLTIYGQAAQSGQLIARGGEFAAGIGGAAGESGHDIAIYGGTITAIGSEDASAIGGGINGGSAYIYISGSHLLKADGSNPPTTVIPHTANEDMAAALSGKRYATIEPVTPPATVTVTTHYATDKSANYGTYYNGMHAYEVVTEGVTLYTASLETVGSDTYLNLHAIEGNILPAATAVVVRSETETNVVLVEYNNSTTDIDVSSNVLQGVDVATATDALGAGSLYILSAQVLSGDAAATTAFYRYMGDTMPANKAYLPLAPGAPAPTRIIWGDSPIVTGVEPLVSGKGQGASDKVLRNGQLYIIKSGHVYTAQGMLVE